MMDMRKVFIVFLSFILSMLFLQSCGGGGSTSSGWDDDDPEEETTESVRFSDAVQVKVHTVEKTVQGASQYISAYISYNYDKKIYKIAKMGYCWDTKKNPTVYANSTNLFALKDAGGETIKPLKGGTTYYVRAFTEINGKFYYSKQMIFKTMDSDIKIDVNLTNKKATIKCNIQRPGSYELLFSAVRWRLDIKLYHDSNYKKTTKYITQGNYSYIITETIDTLYLKMIHIYLTEKSTGIKYYYWIVNET